MMRFITYELQTVNVLIINEMLSILIYFISLFIYVDLERTFVISWALLPYLLVLFFYCSLNDNNNPMTMISEYYAVMQIFNIYRGVFFAFTALLSFQMDNWIPDSAFLALSPIFIGICITAYLDFKAFSQLRKFDPIQHENFMKPGFK